MEVNGITNRQIIKCSNELNTASYKLSEVSLNIIMTLISEIKQEDTDFKPYIFHISELEKKIERKIERAYLDKIADELLKNIIKIKRVEKNSFLKLGWVSSFEYYVGKGIIEVSFDPKLKPYLLSIKEGFVLGFLKEFVDIKGEYSKRIYMLARQNAFKGKMNIDLASLKTMLIVPKSMDEYKVFKQRVLKHAVLQINSKTNLEVSFKEIRAGRKVDRIEFIIKDKFKDKKIYSESMQEWIDSNEIKPNKNIQKTINWSKGE